MEEESVAGGILRNTRVFPNYIQLDCPENTPTPESSVPDYSVEVPDPDHYPVDHKTAPRIYGVKAHIIKLPSSELAPEKSRDARQMSV